jgi:hypothetical protein
MEEGWTPRRVLMPGWGMAALFPRSLVMLMAHRSWNLNDGGEGVSGSCTANATFGTLLAPGQFCAQRFPPAAFEKVK